MNNVKIFDSLCSEYAVFTSTLKLMYAFKDLFEKAPNNKSFPFPEITSNDVEITLNTLEKMSITIFIGIKTSLEKLEDEMKDEPD